MIEPGDVGGDQRPPAEDEEKGGRTEGQGGQCPEKVAAGVGQVGIPDGRTADTNAGAPAGSICRKRARALKPRATQCDSAPRSLRARHGEVAADIGLVEDQIGLAQAVGGGEALVPVGVDQRRLADLVEPRDLVGA